MVTWTEEDPEASEPGTPCHTFAAPITSKLLNYFVTQGDKEEMVTETIEEPASLSTFVQVFLGIALLLVQQ